MNIVSILKDEIRLNSCMTELAFGKTNYNIYWGCIRV